MTVRVVSSNPGPGPGDDRPTLTPRQRRLLAVLSTLYADETYDDIEAIGDEPITAGAEHSVGVLDLFPPATWDRDLTFRRGLARAIDDLAADLDAGGDPEPRCTAEEMALHLVLRRASGSEDGELAHLLDGIAPHPNDHDWRSPSDFLFQDHDVLLMFDPDFVPHRVDYEFLDLELWFTPFDTKTARDPGRGFRR